jgi:hypothetical protein
LFIQEEDDDGGDFDLNLREHEEDDGVKVSPYYLKLLNSNIFVNRVVDPDSLNTEPDPAFWLNPDPVPDPDPR